MIALIPLLNIKFPSNLSGLFQFLAFLNGDLFILNQAYLYSVGSTY